MSFDRNNVQFTEEELVAAEALDAVVEALKDGLQMNDIAVVPQLRVVADYLRGEGEIDKGKVATKIITLGYAMFKDNVDLEF
jgi:hypothetical protein